MLRFSDSAYLDQADGGFPYRLTPYRNLNDQQQLLIRGEAEWTPLPGFHNVFGANYAKFDRLFAGPLDPLAPPTPSPAGPAIEANSLAYIASPPIIGVLIA